MRRLTLGIAFSIAVGIGCGGIEEEAPGGTDSSRLAASSDTPKPGAIYTSKDSDCGHHHVKFGSLQEVHVNADKAPEGVEFDAKLYGPSFEGQPLGTRVVFYADRCVRLDSIFPEINETPNNGGVYKLEICGDPAVTSSCFSQNFKLLDQGGTGEDEPKATLHVRKYYDTNREPDHVDASGTELHGWRFVITSEDGTSFTVESPYVNDELEPGTYTVTEIAANESNWHNSTPMTVVVTLEDGDEKTIGFGNYCELSPGGHTMGWWQNKNGEGELKSAPGLAYHLGKVDALNLRNLQGAHQADFGNDYNAFKAWLKGAKANPMAYMLSAQLATMVLSIEVGHTNPAIDVEHAPGQWITTSGLAEYADELLGIVTPGANVNANKTEEGRVKDLIDAVNNGASWVQRDWVPGGDDDRIGGSNCPYTF